MKRLQNRFFRILAFALLFFSSCVSKNEKVMRNRDIGLFVVNKVDFESRFRPIVQNFNEQSFHAILKSMGEQLKVSNNISQKLQIGEYDLPFEALFSIDDSSLIFKKKILEEIIEKYSSGKIDSLSSTVDIDILQPILFYTSSEYFKDKFYYDLLYYPPLEFSTLFSLVDVEANKPTSSEVEYQNPYYPLCKGLEEDGQIYHLVLKREVLMKLRDELLRQKAILNILNLKCDFVFFEHILNEAINDKILLIKQISP